MQTNCDHEFVTVATFESRGCKVEQCVRCEETRTRWLADAYVVPTDPTDALGCDSCQ
jgi:hypothetical protein